MNEKRTSTYILRVVAFFLIFSVILGTLYACKEKPDTEDGDTPSSSESVSDGESTDGTDESDPSGTDESSQDDSSSGTADGSTSGKTNSAGSSSRTNSSGKTTTKKVGTTAKATTTTAKATTPTTTKSNTYYAPRVYSNSAPGTAVFSASDGSAVVDYSNTASGYVMVKYSGGYSNIRVQAAGPNGVTQTYIILSRNAFEAIPLTGGNGNYTISVYGNNGGTSYYSVASGTISASLSYSTAPYLRPNVNVNYNSSTSCVQYAAQLTRGCDTDLAKVEAIYKYVVKNFRYDNAKAASVANAAYVPNLNSVWSSKSGICYDYASTMTAMLRTQGIPTRVQVGYVNGSTYHAWISTYIQGSGWIDNIIYFNGTSWKLMDPTFASTGGIGYDWSQRSSYSVRYVY